ncbi:MAG: CNNM domain-containing protein, partial [Ginsengibacter sp.]
MDWIPIAAMISAALLIGFFSGIEIAFISVSKLSVELKRKQGRYSGKIWSAFMEKPPRFIGTTLLVVNLLLVIYALLWSKALQSIWIYWGLENPYVQLAAETVFAAFILIFIQFLFKAFFRAKGNRIIGSGFIAFIVSTFYSLFTWIAVYLVKMAEWILKYIFNVKLQNKVESFIKIDLDHYVQQIKMNENDDSAEMNNDIFENVLSLSETRVRACLIPRKEIISIDIHASLEELKKKFIETNLSKLIVYEDNIDTIKGYIHQLDLFKNPENLRSILLEIPKIPTSMNATDLINKFSKERKSIAWVIDEFGGTAGIITMEDLLEEIFGDIYDEYDVKEDVPDSQI